MVLVVEDETFTRERKAILVQNHWKNLGKQSCSCFESERKYSLILIT